MESAAVVPEPEYWSGALRRPNGAAELVGGAPPEDEGAVFAPGHNEETDGGCVKDGAGGLAEGGDGAGRAGEAGAAGTAADPVD